MMDFRAILNISSTILAISAAAILGVLTRVFLNSLFGPTGADVTSMDRALFYDIPANVLGCFLLGAFMKVKEKYQIAPMVSVAISTGYTGSVTTFASWNYQITRMLVPGDWLHAVFAAIIGTALPYVAFLVGRDVSLCIIQMHSLKRTPVAGDSEITSANPQSDIDVDVDPEVDPDPDVESKSSATVGQNELPSNELTLRTHLIYFFFTLPLCISLLVATSAAAAVDRHHPIRRTKWASGAFAPLGATTRWLLSRFNRHGWFPRGTFIANMIGTLLDAVIGVVIILRDTGKSLDIVLPALISGLGGSLSTVSTWVNEASAMSRSHRYIYLATSLAVAQVLSILVYGTASWV